MVGVFLPPLWTCFLGLDSERLLQSGINLHHILLRQAVLASGLIRTSEGKEGFRSADRETQIRLLAQLDTLIDLSELLRDDCGWFSHRGGGS